MAAVRVLHEIQISPSPLLPTQPPQPLSYLDSLWLRSSLVVERLFFYEYPHPISHFRYHELPILTKSLSLALRHFYLLAGSIRPSPVSDDQFEIAYTEGDSVAVTVAEFIGGDHDFHDISGHQPRDFKTLRLLVPKTEKSSSCGQFPPVSVQITLFRNKGICVCFAINHAACDGSASMQFIRSWAAAHRSTESVLDNIPPPFLDRSVIVDTHGIDQKLTEMANRFKEMLKEHYMKKKESFLPASDPNLVSATFTISKDQIAGLKERVRSKGAEEGKPTLHISAFVVTCAFVWRCIEKARENEAAVKHYFSSAVDWRSRMRPAPIPGNYFGNCVGACMAEMEARELVGKGGFELAAMEIGKCIDGLQGRDVGEVFAETIDRFMNLAGSGRPLSVAGSPKLRVYETDFGWGKPVKVEMTSIKETGAISLAESRGEEGGLEIGLVLSEDDMIKFGNIFSTDLLHALA